MRKFVYLFIVLIIQLTLAKSAHSVSYDWHVCYDTSRSVPEKQFVQYPDIIRSSVLELLRPGEGLTMLKVDQVGGEPETFALENRLSRFERTVGVIYSRLREMNRSPAHYPTDFGLVFNHLRLRIELDEKLKTGKPVRHILVCVTDGVPDGRQTKGNWKSLPKADWKILFVGVKEGTEEGLRRFAEQVGFRNHEATLIVPFTHWKEIAPSLPKFIGRSPNPSLAKVLSQQSRSIKKVGGQL